MWHKSFDYVTKMNGLSINSQLFATKLKAYQNLRIALEGMGRRKPTVNFGWFECLFWESEKKEVYVYPRLRKRPRTKICFFLGINFETNLYRTSSTWSKSNFNIEIDTKFFDYTRHFPEIIKNPEIYPPKSPLRKCWPNCFIEKFKISTRK